MKFLAIPGLGRDNMVDLRTCTFGRRKPTARGLPKDEDGIWQKGLGLKPVSQLINYETTGK